MLNNLKFVIIVNYIIINLINVQQQANYNSMAIEIDYIKQKTDATKIQK